MNKDSLTSNNVIWNEENIASFKKDLQKLKDIQLDIFFTQKSKELIGCDLSHKLMHDLRAFFSIISNISFNNPNEKNADILINASEFWIPAEKILNKLKKICTRGERTSYKNKMMHKVDHILKMKTYLGDSQKLALIKKQWMLYGLVTIPIALVIITLLFILLTYLI